MDTKVQHGYLVLADISGYSAYLAGVELEHAHEILAELLELIVSRLRPLFTISEIEGDAVFAYVPAANVPRGETLLEAIESTYVAFRDRLEAMCRATTCTCRACRDLPRLDLKFIAHHGTYIEHTVSGRTKLVGTDVNLAHRLLKNHIADATSWQAYALFTEPVFDHLDIRPEGLHPQAEAYDLGTVQTVSYDLRKRYAAIAEARRVVVLPAEADTVITIECAASPAVVWDWLNLPKRRALWEHHTIQPVARPAGRTSAGASNHCLHGKSAPTIETVLDWRPFEYYTVETVATQPMPMRFIITHQLEPSPDRRSTRVVVTATFDMRAPRLLRRPVCHLFFAAFGIQRQYRELVRLIANEGQPEAALQPVLAAA